MGAESACSSYEPCGYKKIPLTQGQAALVDADDYDWLTQWKWCAAKTRSGDFYAIRNEPVRDGSRHHLTVRMHRAIAGLEDGDQRQVDHVNRNKLDNRRSNLRVCDPSENDANGGLQRNNKSGYIGVSWSKRQEKWVAQAWGRRDGVRVLKNLGAYDDKLDAARAYNEYVRATRGAFAVLNDIE